MTKMTLTPATCGDCGLNTDKILIVSTVIGKSVVETLCCHDPRDSADTLAVSACMAGFLDRAAAVLHATIEHQGHGYAEVFVDDDHFVKISPTSGAILRDGVWSLAC